MTKVGVTFCPLFMPEISGFVGSTCAGIINQQFGESILPFIMDDFLSEEVFCSYKMEVCDMENYDEIDLKQVVFDELHKKTDLANQNNFINNMYAENKERLSAYKKEDLVKVVLMSDLHMDSDY
jgi:hypothetical protein